MYQVIFATPFLSENAVRFIRTIVELQDVRLGIVTQDYQENLSVDLQSKVDFYFRVENELDVDQLIEAVEFLRGQMGSVHRLLAVNEQIQIPIAEVRKRLQLPGPKPGTVRNFRDKFRMKSLLAEANIPCARFRLVENEKEAWDFIRETGYPVVAKPPEGAGGISTYELESDEDLREVLRNSPPEPGHPLLLEEFISGLEHSFDTFSLNGQPLWHSIIHYYPAPLDVMRNPWIQWRALLPREVDHPVYPRITEAAHRALEVLVVEILSN